MEHSAAVKQLDSVVKRLESISSTLRHTKPIIGDKRIILELGSAVEKIAEDLATLGQEMQKE